MALLIGPMEKALGGNFLDYLTGIKHHIIMDIIDLAGGASCKF